MSTHYLKTWPQYFWAVYGEVKTFEVRKNDRDFKVGDILRLREWEPQREVFTGQELRAEITYILDGEHSTVPGIEPGYCVLGIHLQD